MISKIFNLPQLCLPDKNREFFSRTDESGLKGCFTGELKDISFTNTDVVELNLAYQVPCDVAESEPVESAIEVCNNPTIKSVTSGSWSEPSVLAHKF